MNTLNVVESIFFTALEKATPEARAAYLAEACDSDANLRRCVERLLNAHVKADGIIPVQAPGLPATIEPPPIEERPGTIIGSYKLLQQLGEGGFGVVFMAEQEQPVRRKVALKIIKPGMDSKQVVARFEAERQALALMDHPNIARVFDGGTTDSGRPYFVMELVKGTPITEFCDKHRLTPRERLELFIPVCQAVQHAHQKGIIHRDIKPSNVLITMYDDKPVPKVIDFGIAKAIAEKLTEQTLFTRVGQVIGTLEYMSPEQASLNALDVDTRADVYALGVLLYELLTGSTPLNKDRIQGVAFLEMLRLIREEEPPKPSTRLSQSGDALTSYALDRRTDRQKLPKMVKGELDWITMKALEKDRTRRYETANALASDVQRYLKDEQVEACPPSFTYRLQKYARKHKTAFAMTSMAAVLLLFGIAATSWQAVRATLAETDVTIQRNAVVAAELQVRTERDEARTANVHLHDAQQDLKRTLYFARANLLQNAWEANNTLQVVQLLDQQRPRPGEPDLRDFEWHYRDRMCHQDLLTIATTSSYWPEQIIPAFSPDGKYVAAQAKELKGKPRRGEIAIFSLADGSERTRVKLDAKLSVGSLQWSADSKRVLIVRLSERLTGIRTFPKTEETETLLEFVICDAADGHVISRAPVTDEDVGFKGHISNFSVPTLSPHEKYFAISGGKRAAIASGKILLGDMATGKIIRQFGDSLGQPRYWAFSPDGRRLAAAIQVGDLAQSSELLIKVWDTASGDELLSKKAPGSNIRFSPDGNRLAIIGSVNFPKRSSAFTAWDLTSGKEMNTFPLTQEEKENDDRLRRSLNFFVFNPDTTRLAVYTGPGDGPSEIRLFDTATGEVVETIRNVPNMTTQHTYDGKFQTSPDGKMLAAGGSDGTVCVWDLGAGRAANGAPALVFRSHTSEISRVEFHPDGSRLFSADMDGMVKVWDVVTRDRPVVIQEAANFAGPVAFSATSGRLLTIYHPRAPKAGNGKKGTPDEANKPGPVPMEKSKITVWDLTGKPLASFASPVPGFNNGRGYHPIVLSRDGTRLALISSVGSGPRDGAELHIIEADTGKEVFMRKIGEAGSLGTAAPAFSRDGKQIALGFAEAAEGREKFSPRSGPAHVKLLDSSDGTEIRRIAVGEGAIQSLAFSPDGSRLALATGGFQTKPAITIWDVRTGERLVKLVSKWQPTEALLFSDDGTRLASIVRGFGFDQKNEVFVWDAATGKTLLTLPGHSSRFLNIAFSPNGRRIATATSSGPRYGSGTPGTRQGNEIKLWDAATGDELMTLKDLDRNTAGHLSFSADGTRLYAVGGSNQSVRDGKIELRTWDATPRR